MLTFPNAKINFGLHVTRKRPDGYHNIESIFYPIPLRDALEVVISEKTTFTQTGLPLEITSEHNLVMKAYALMAASFAVPKLDIYLKKAIPSGAGLGGGSADAAFMLKLLFDLCYKNETHQDEHLLQTRKQSHLQLHELASALGADCPFFIPNVPAIVTGTGNQFQPTRISLSGYTVFIVKPPVSVSTTEAYAMVKPQKPTFALENLSSIPVSEWKNVLINDFEPVLFKKYPVIEEIKEKLYATGAVYASMSGSGSAVYGLFTDYAISPTFDHCYTWKGLLD